MAAISGAMLAMVLVAAAAFSVRSVGAQRAELKELDGKYVLNETARINRFDYLLCAEDMWIQTAEDREDEDTLSASSLSFDEGTVKCDGTQYNLNPQTDLTFSMPFENGKLILDLKEGFGGTIPDGESITCGNRTFISRNGNVATFIYIIEAVFRVIEATAGSETEYRVQIKEQAAMFAGEMVVGGQSHPNHVCVYSYDGSFSPCFPAESQVAMADGTAVAMRDLRLGDRVAAGGGATSEVFFFSHRSAHQAQRYVQLEAEGARKMRVSGGHLVYLEGMKRVSADRVRVGDRLMLADAVQSVRVEKVSKVRDVGLYHPHTLSGDMVVDGFLVSTYSTLMPPALAHTLLSPLRALHIVCGSTCALSWLENDAAPWILRVVRQVSALW